MGEGPASDFKKRRKPFFLENMKVGVKGKKEGKEGNEASKF